MASETHETVLEQVITQFKAMGFSGEDIAILLDGLAALKRSEYQRGYAEGVKAALAAVRGRGAAIDNGTVTGKTVAAVVLEAVDEAEKALVKT